MCLRLTWSSCTRPVQIIALISTPSTRRLSRASATFTAECKAGVAQRKRCFDDAHRQDGSFDFDRYLVLLDADVRAGNHSIGAPAKEP